jgi:hypothetical protein
MTALRYIVLIAAMTIFAGCAEEAPPRSVTEFMDNPNLLEAVLVRCRQNRNESRYEAECVNGREAVKLLEAEEDVNVSAQLEAESKRKRDALRRTQRAVAEARRRAAEGQKRREEAEYLAQFGELPPTEEPDVEEMTGNIPLAVIPETVNEQESASGETVDLPAAGSNAPVIETAPADEPPADLESIRDELSRRSDDGNQ